MQLHLNTYLYSLLQESRAIPHLSGLSLCGMSQSNTGEDVSDDVVSEESVKNAYDMIGWELEYSFYRYDMWTLLDASSDSA